MENTPDLPNRLVIEISRNCNLHCKMCGFGGNPLRENWFIHPDILDQILYPSQETADFLKNIEEIRLNGRGESTLHPKLGDIISQLVRQYPSIRFSLFTNLMFPDPQIMELFLSHNIDLYISVDSPDSKKYEAIRIGAKFDLLLKRLIMLQNGFLVFTLQMSNLLELESIGRFALANQFGLIINIIRSDDINYRRDFSTQLDQHWEEIIRQLKVLKSHFAPDSLLIPDQIWNRVVPLEIATTTSCGNLSYCPNLLQEIMIGYDGSVYPCNMFSPIKLGTMKTESLRSIWQSKIRQDFLREYKHHPYCNHCEYMILKRT